MKKLKKKAMPLLLGLIICTASVVPDSIAALASESLSYMSDLEDEEAVGEAGTSDEDGGTEEEDPLVAVASEEAAASSTSESNNLYISNFITKKIVDGTSPWDDDDEAGNDSANNNLIVRTFDNVNYTLEYVTAVHDNTADIGSNTLCVEYTLEGDPSELRWNTDQLNYLEDLVITMTREDGTVETIDDYDDFDYDGDNLVVTQVVTGTYEVSVSGGTGSGTLAAGVTVEAAANGDTFLPTFKAWIDGDSDDEVMTAEPLYAEDSDDDEIDYEADTITVSAAPRYDICLNRNTYVEYLGYFNLESGTFARSQESDDDIYGEMLGYGITIRLYNNSTDKEMKGIELPTGDISFDITLSEALQAASDSDAVDVTDTEGFEPVLWEYRENQSGNSSTVGYLGRTVYFNSSSTVYARGTVGNKNTSRSWKYCYNGGTWTIEQDSEESNVYHVTISGYEFDMEDFHYPTGAIDYTTGQSLSGYGSYIGAFSAGYVQYICQADKNQISTASVLKSTIAASNLAVSTLSDNAVTSTDSGGVSQEMVTSNNTSTVTVDLYPPGSISKQNWWGDSNETKLGTIANSFKDGTAYVGDTVTVWSGIQLSLNFSLQSVNILQKIDADYVTVPEGTTTYCSYTLANSVDSTYGTVTTWFAAKTDGTNWEDQDEMNTTDEEELIYFSSIDDLTSAGYTCVGFLYEIRDAEIYGTKNWSDVSIKMAVTINNNVSSGSVMTTENDVRAWKSDDVVSCGSFVYSTVTGSDGRSITVYGLGDTETEWGSADTPSGNTYYLTDEDGNDTGYVTPDFDIRQDGYTAVIYENGTIAGGANGGYQYGNSLLIITAKNSIDISVSDTTSSGSTKTSYNIGNGETTVNYEITPALTTSSSNNENSGDATTDLTVEVTIPSTMTLSVNSMAASGTTSTGYSYACSWVENDDGTWTVTYIVYDVAVDTSVGTLPLVAEILQDEVEHAEEITVTAIVYCEFDQRACTTTNGNLSTASINIIKLVSIDVKKTVSDTIVELGEDFSYTLTYTNTSEETVEDLSMLDIMPYENDEDGDGEIDTDDDTESGYWHSDYSGAYEVKDIILDFSDAPDTWAVLISDGSLISSDAVTLYFSEDENLEDSAATSIDGLTADLKNGITSSDGKYYDDQGHEWQIDSSYTIDPDAYTITFSGRDGTDTIGIWCHMASLCAAESVYMTIEMSFTDSDGELYEDSDGAVQQPGDYYANACFELQASQTSVAVSNKVSTRVVKRSVSGLVWYDEDQDGIRDDEEELFEDVTVTLYSTTASGTALTTIDSVELYQAYDVYGNAVNSVTTDENGAYEFTDLPYGTYYVMFTGNDDFDMEIYQMTAQSAGDDDTVDSDAVGVTSDDCLSYAYIEAIALPTAESLAESSASYEYVSANNDAGLVATTASVEVYKYGSNDDTDPIEGATYTIYTSDGEEFTSFTTDEDGYSGLIEDLVIGDYYLQETEAPDGYYINDSTYEFSVAKSDLGSTITITVYDNTLEILPSSGGKGVFAILLLSVGIGVTSCALAVSGRRRIRGRQ